METNTVFEYIRTTHDFNNETREWEFKKDLKSGLRGTNKQWTFGVHALERNYWETLDWIVNNTINLFRGDAAGYSGIQALEKLIASNPNYRDVIKKEVEEELVELVELGWVKRRTRKVYSYPLKNESTDPNEI